MAKNLKTTVEFQLEGDPVESLLNAARIGFAQVATELVGRFDDSLSGNYWPWGGPTPRFGSSTGSTLAQAAENWNTWATGKGNGKAPQSIAGSPRNIIDSGDLKQSRQFDFNRQAMVAKYSWNVDYAAAVYFGATFHPFQNQTKTVTTPGRPWVAAVLEGGTAGSVPVYPVAENLKRFITNAAARENR